MAERYEETADMTSPTDFLAACEREHGSLPTITYLDDYLHFREQLKLMRGRSQEFNPARFAMEMAVYLRIQEYEERIGVPLSLMPEPNGSGGVVQEEVVPHEWMST